ncbi:MAG TPA: hypothetical protein DIC42_05965 [Holosporales bacterium]|nr:hypothetical protein [Holosporales bacterium]
MIKAYQAVQNASNTIQLKALNSMPQAKSGGASFASEIKEQMRKATDELKETDHAIKSFTLGDIGSEEIMLHTARHSVEAKGKIEVIRSIVDSINKIVNINM